MARNIEFDEAAILSRAQQVFWEKGYHATSMQDLVKATGLNPGSLYNSFGSKHDLFLLCLKDYTQPIHDFVPSEKGNKNSLELLQAYIKSIAANGGQSEKACLSAKSCLELAATDSDVHQALQSTVVKGLSNLEQLIANAQKDKFIRQDLEPAVLAQLVNATLTGLGPNFIIFKEKKRINKIVDHLFQLMRS